MRVGIITITDGQNYGNRLQNYALQKVLSNWGVEVVTFKRKTIRDIGLKKRVIKEVKQIAKLILGVKTSEFGINNRKRKFRAFNKKYIKFSRECLYNNVAPENLNDKYDFFICGSDQIWNTRFDIISEDIKNYLAFFASPEKKIAYAASFGTDSIEPEYKSLFSQQLATYKRIGIREESAVKLIADCCGREDAVVVLDPTMLLSKEEWDEISDKPSYILDNERYVLTYFLSGRTPQMQAHIERVCKQYNAKPINLDIEFLLDNQIECRPVFASSPAEFVYLISHAQAVLTDSFHACVFSIIYGMPFCAYQRMAHEKGNNMSSRIETLLGRFHLEQFVDDISNPTQIPTAFDLSQIPTILESEREKSIHFLRQALQLQ